MRPENILIWGVPFVLLVMVAALVLMGIRRKLRFKRRSEVPLCDWVGSIGIRSRRGVVVSEKVLKALGEEMGVAPTHFRPEDSFDHHFALVPPWVGISNHVVEDFLNDVARILWEEGVRNWYRFKYRKKCLRDLLLEIDAALVESESSEVVQQN